MAPVVPTTDRKTRAANGKSTPRVFATVEAPAPAGRKTGVTKKKSVTGAGVTKKKVGAPKKSATGTTTTKTTKAAPTKKTAASKPKVAAKKVEKKVKAAVNGTKKEVKK